VLDPATGSVHVLPEPPAAVHLNEENLAVHLNEENLAVHFNEENLIKPYTSFAFGRIGATGEY